MLPISVVILTLNETTRMERCLSSLNQAARVVLIDSYSQDGTLEEAGRVWAKLGRSPQDLSLVSLEWRGFTQTRNESLKWVTTPYVFWVDADEWIEPALWNDLEKLSSSTEKNVYFIPRLSYFLGRSIKFGGWYPDRKARFAASNNCVWKNGPHGSDVHEDLYPLNNSERKVLKTRHHIFHESFRNIQEQRDTNLRYSSLLAEGLSRKWREQKKSAPSNVWISFKVGVKFLENYFWKLGILDAYPGFLIARGSAESMGMRLRRAKALLESKSDA